jgi:1-phosphofructokinase family hexose kinase
MILCLTLNAAIDKTAVVSPFRLNAIHRPQEVLALAGGKGCNVARALRTLGADALVSGWVGGFAGQFIEARLHAEGIKTAFVHTEAESRMCFSILDPEGGTLTEVYEKGEPIAADRQAALLERVREALPGCTAVALSGSLPAGVPTDFYARLIEIAVAAGIPAYLDSSGPALAHGLAAQPCAIKPNRAEFADLTGSDAADIAGCAEAAARVAAERGVLVVLSLGADGAIAADGRAILHARPPRLEIVSAVGSGDCLLAGVIYGLTQGWPLAEALACGTAAGTANALSIGAGRFTRTDYDRVREQVSVAIL